MAATRRRLDVELVRRRLTSSTAAARSLIDSGRVQVSGASALKPSRLVSAAEAVVVDVADSPAYASRGGVKLAAALDRFGVDPANRVVLDAGASTGGFTDCLLRRGARRVFAVDVGRGQLLTRLANDPRVVVMDRCNIRNLTSAQLPEPTELLTADLAFISLRTVMGNLAELASPGADLLLLVKPQFEVERHQASRSAGVITDPRLWRQALDGVSQAVTDSGLELRSETESPVRGTAGNTEFFIHAQRPTDS